MRLTEHAANPAGSGLARATLFNLAGILVPVLVQLVTVPFYIKIIGTDRYGVMALVWLLLGYFGVFDLGFGRAIASRIAGMSAETPAAREQVFWTGTCLSLLAGAGGGLVLYAAATHLFTNVLAVPIWLLAETHGALPFLALALPVITGISALSGALQGREAFGAMNLSQMTGGVLYQLFPLLVACTVSVGLPGLVLAALAGRLVTAAMLFGFCLSRVPARASPRLTRSQIRPLITYGGWVTVTGLISPLLTVFDRFVIGAITGMTAVTAYTIPYNLVMRLAALPSSLQNALFPRFAMTDTGEARLLQAEAVTIVNCVMTPLLLFSLLAMKPFLNLWIGPAIAATAAPVGQILILGLWPNMLAFIPFGFLQSRSRPDLPAKFHFAELFFYAPALYFLTRHLGVSGAAWAWDARTLADAALLFAAVKLLSQVLAGWFGLVLVFAGFVWTNYGGLSANVYVAGAGLLFAVSLAWAWVALPPRLKRELSHRLSPCGRRVART